MLSVTCSFLLFLYISQSIVRSQICSNTQCVHYGGSPLYVCTESVETCTIYCGGGSCANSIIWTAASLFTEVRCGSSGSCDNLQLICGYNNTKQAMGSCKLSCRSQHSCSNISMSCNGNIQECGIEPSAIESTGEVDGKEGAFDGTLTCNLNNPSASCYMDCHTTAVNICDQSSQSTLTCLSGIGACQCTLDVTNPCPAVTTYSESPTVSPTTTIPTTTMPTTIMPTTIMPTTAIPTTAIPTGHPNTPFPTTQGRPGGTTIMPTTTIPTTTIMPTTAIPTGHPNTPSPTTQGGSGGTTTSTTATVASTTRIEQESEANVFVNISLIIAVNNTEIDKIVNVTLHSFRVNNYNNFTYKLTAISGGKISFDFVFIVPNTSTSGLINYANHTLSDDIMNEGVNVQIVYIDVQRINVDGATQNELSLKHIDDLFEYVNIAIVVGFTFMTITGFVDATFIRINDVFRIGKMIHPLINVLDTMSDVFLCLEVSFVYNANHNLVYLILLICMISFIAMPVTFSVFQLVGVSNKHWIKKTGNDMDNSDCIRAWLQNYVYILYIISIVTGSSFSAISLFNSNLYGLQIFDMGLSESSISHFTTKRIYSIVLCENIPQVILQFIYLKISDNGSIILLASMTFSVISILVTLIAVYTQQRINYTQSSVIVKFDVCSNSVAQNANILRNRLNKVGIQISSILGVENRLIEVMRPKIIKYGLQITLKANVNSNKLAEFEQTMNESESNGLLLSAIKSAWNMKAINNDNDIKITNICVSSKESKQTIADTVHIQLSSKNVGEGINLNYDNNINDKNKNKNKNHIVIEEGMNYNINKDVTFIPVPSVAAPTPGNDVYSDSNSLTE